MTEGRGQKEFGIADLGCGIWDCGFWILDCAHVKSALPFHIRENLTGQVG